MKCQAAKKVAVMIVEEQWRFPIKQTRRLYPADAINLDLVINQHECRWDYNSSYEPYYSTTTSTMCATVSRVCSSLAMVDHVTGIHGQSRVDGGSYRGF